MHLPYYHTAHSGTDEYRLSPSKILGIGRNYRAHAAEMGADVPEHPIVFLKPPSALLAPEGAIVRPIGFDRVDYEGELAVIIGRRAQRVSVENAMAHVLGFTCGNDVTVRDLQKRDGQWSMAKGMDTFCPLGPRIVAGLDPGDLRITTRVNGEVRQDARTSLLIFPIPELIARISRYVTLEPGDVILTGTPAGIGNLQAGDTVEVEIEGIGTLRNHVVDEAA